MESFKEKKEGKSYSHTLIEAIALVLNFCDFNKDLQTR
jgi:hypothetical protein